MTVAAAPQWPPVAITVPVEPETATGGAADWQAAAKAELGGLRAVVAKRRELARKTHEEVAGLRAESAMASLQFRRQGRALSRQAALATQQSTRARSLALRAGAAARHARAEAHDRTEELRGAQSLLAVRDAENMKLRDRVAGLERRLDSDSREAERSRDLVILQGALLDEAEAVLRGKVAFSCAEASPSMASNGSGTAPSTS